MKHRIIIDLNLAGYDERDVDDLRSTPLSECPVRVELRRYPPSEAPERYRILIEIAAATAAWSTTDEFPEEFSKGLHSWARNQLGVVFGRKTGADGLTELRFEDATITVPYHPHDARFAEALLRMRHLLGSIGSLEHKRWEITLDGTQGDWRLVPVTPPSVPPSGQDSADRQLPSLKELALEFEDEMLELYRRAYDECGYRATSFLGLVQSEGGVATAKRLLRPGPVSRGLASLFELGRLDLSVEALVTSHPKWRSLFAPDEIAVARERLEELRRQKP